MKKLILAPAVALAFAGLTAAPVAAAETQTESAASTVEQKAAEAPAEDEAPAEETPAASADESEEPVEEPAEKPTETSKPKPEETTAPEPDPAPEENSEENAESKGDAEAAKTAAFTLSTDSISVSDLREKGITVTGTGYAPGGNISIVITSPVDGGAQQVAEAVADADGAFTTVVKSEQDFPLGTYSVVANNSGESSSATKTFTVTEDEVPEIDASLEVDPTEITAQDLADENKGFVVTVSGLLAGDTVTDSLTNESTTVDEDGSIDIAIHYMGDPGDLEPGAVPFTVTIDREGVESQTLDGEITVIEEPVEVADPSLTVSPKTIEAADFVNEKKGVLLSVENCEPGSDVVFTVNPKGLKITAFESTETADDEGRASVSVHGTTSNTSAYVGDYTVTAACGDDSMNGAFSVTGGARGGEGDSVNGTGTRADEDVNSGGDLPRTGADLGGLTTGAILLLVGGAAVALTGRRKKSANSPSEF